MLGVMIQLILSWIILKIIQKQNLSALGFFPLKKRLTQLLIGVLFVGSLCALVEISNSILTHLSWKLNPSITYVDIINSIWWNLKSVLFEELIFRGALLYIVIKRIGSRKGIILSAVCFGIYHWFSNSVLGNMASMIIVFLITGFMGLIWAFGFLKSRSIGLPIGLHFGWNFATNAIFSKGPIGQQILIPIKGLQYSNLTGISSLFIFLTQNIVVIMLTYLFIRCYSKREFNNV